MYEDSTIQREEYVRLVLQSLKDIGYRYVAISVFCLVRVLLEFCIFSLPLAPFIRFEFDINSGLGPSNHREVFGILVAPF